MNNFEKIKNDMKIVKKMLNNGYNSKARYKMKPILNVNFDLNIATLVFSDGYAVTTTYNELKEIYKLLKDSFEILQEDNQL